MCLFCKIISGEIPSQKIYEDDAVLAILDIAQTTKGHTLVMPKKHYENVLEMPEDEYTVLMLQVQKLAQKIVANLEANGVNILANTNEAAGQTIPHAHVHIIPRYDENDGLKISFTENQLDLAAIAAEINKY